MLEHFAHDHAVVRTVGERQSEGVGPRRAAQRVRGCLPLLGHGVEHFLRARQLGHVEVDRDDVGAAAMGLERVTTGAAAEVEHPLAGAYAQPVVVDCQHQLRASSSAR